MSRVLSSFLVPLLFFLGESGPCAGALLHLQGGVTGSVCELRSTRGPDLALSALDFRHSWALPGRDAFTLFFPDARCRASAFGHGGSLRLVVQGPDAEGGKGMAWGERHRDIAYGVRLQYRQSGPRGRSHLVSLSPEQNVMTLHPPSGHHWYGEDLTDFRVTIRPELVTWDPRRVNREHPLDVPLVFLVVWP